MSTIPEGWEETKKASSLWSTLLWGYFLDYNYDRIREKSTKKNYVDVIKAASNEFSEFTQWYREWNEKNGIKRCEFRCAN